MTKLVLLRHGESTWNKENRFTGWTDVDLSEKGLAEAHQAGKLLKENGFVFDIAFTSVLKRAIRTLWITLDEMDSIFPPRALISPITSPIKVSGTKTSTSMIGSSKKGSPL